MVHLLEIYCSIIRIGEAHSQRRALLLKAALLKRHGSLGFLGLPGAILLLAITSGLCSAIGAAQVRDLKAPNF